MRRVALRTQIVRKRPRPAGHRGHVPWIRPTPGFTPTRVPTKPPPGLYDPAIDAQERATQRGLGDVVDDTARDRVRLATDTTTGKQAVDRGAGRSLADILSARRRAGEDWTTAAQDRQRNYNNLGVGQGAQAQSQGVAGGGTLAAALAVRAANQSREQDASNRQLGRFNEDSQTSASRVEEDRQLDHGRLDLGFTRGNEDLDTGVTRAGREATQFGIDAAEARTVQAGQAGYQPPTKPSNEFGAPGAEYQVRKFGKNVGHYDAAGNLIWLNGRKVVNGRVV